MPGTMAFKTRIHSTESYRKPVINIIYRIRTTKIVGRIRNAICFHIDDGALQTRKDKAHSQVHLGMPRRGGFSGYPKRETIFFAECIRCGRSMYEQLLECHVRKEEDNVGRTDREDARGDENIAIESDPAVI